VTFKECGGCSRGMCEMELQGNSQGTPMAVDRSRGLELRSNSQGTRSVPVGPKQHYLEPDVLVARSGGETQRIGR
jgi:hypothetical protein